MNTSDLTPNQKRILIFLSSNQFIDFKNDFLTRSLRYLNNQRERISKADTNESVEELARKKGWLSHVELKGATSGERNRNYKIFTEAQALYELRRKTAKELQLSSLTLLADINEINDVYERNILSLTIKLSEKGVVAERCACTAVYSDIGLNVEILDRKTKKTIHARTIIAEGPVVRPHYRFIITERE